MREIKFRGFSLLGKKWVYGSYFKSDHSSIGHCILNESGLGHHEVAPKSVGQYTGLKDENGVEICEGDIVKGWIHNPSEHHIVEYVSDEYNCGFMASKIGRFGKIHVWYAGLEVIGNIYENPELLEQSK